MVQIVPTTPPAGMGKALLNYSPSTVNAYDKSQSFADALANLHANHPISSAAQLAAELLAEGLTRSGQKKSDAQLRAALLQDQQTRMGGYDAKFTDQPAAAPTVQPAPVQQPDPVAQPQTQPVPQAQPAQQQTDLSNVGGIIQKILGVPAQITSGLRSAAHNAAVGGVPNSAHLSGNAVDFVPQGMATSQAVQKIASAGVPFDQLIDEGSHVHLAWGEHGRGEVLARTPQGYQHLGNAQPPQAAPQPQVAPVATPQAQPPTAPVQSASGGLHFTPEQVQTYQFYRRTDPEKAIAYADSVLAETKSPPRYTTTTRNGVPVMVNENDPTDIHEIKVPNSQTQTQTGAQLGLSGDPTQTYAVDPNHNVTAAGNAAPAGFRYSPGGLQTTPGGPQDPTSPANALAGEQTLRNDYENHTKNYRAAREGYNKVVSAAGTGTPAGDIALVFGYMKTLDPTSTVREGEQAQVNNSGTIPQTITNMYNKLLTGSGRLAPEQRQQFADSAKQQFGVYQQQQDAINQRYAGFAQSYGFKPEHVIQQFDPIKPYAGEQAPAPGARKAPDGKWYVQQNGRYFEVRP